MGSGNMLRGWAWVVQAVAPQVPMPVLGSGLGAANAVRRCTAARRTARFPCCQDQAVPVCVPDCTHPCATPPSALALDTSRGEGREQRGGPWGAQRVTRAARCGAQEIKKRHRELVLKHHPDKARGRGGPDDEAARSVPSRSFDCTPPRALCVLFRPLERRPAALPWVWSSVVRSKVRPSGCSSATLSL
jgi:hypothetical protein